MGYDPYDYFDLGDFDQKGGVKTWYGNRAELEALIAKAHKNGVGLYADMVINHNSGADEEEVNPLDGQKRWTKFNPKSGIFPRDYNHFHPSRYERAIVEGENYAGFPHLCHRNPEVYAAMYRYARMLIEELGFDGFRFDYVKGFGAWMIGLLAKYQYVKNGKEFQPYVVGEYWSGADDIEGWLERVDRVYRQPDRRLRLPPALQAEGRLRHPQLRPAQPHRRRLRRDEASAPRRHLRRQPRHGRQHHRQRQADGLLLHHGARGLPLRLLVRLLQQSARPPAHAQRHRRPHPGPPQVRRRRLADTARRPRPLHHAARRLEGRRRPTSRA